MLEPEPEACDQDVEQGTGVLACSGMPGVPSLVSEEGGGQLRYTAYTAHGDKLPDYSHCGFGGGGKPLPAGLVSLTCETIEPVLDEQDSTGRLQAALDRAAELPVGSDGAVEGTIDIELGGAIMTSGSAPSIFLQQSSHFCFCSD